MLGSQRLAVVGWLLLLVVGGLLDLVGHGLLSSCVQRRNNKKKLDILMTKIQLAPNQQEEV